MKHERRCSRACGADVSFRDVTIEIPDRGMWMISRTGSVDWDLRKAVSLVLASEEDGWLSELSEALRRVPQVLWGRWKSQHRNMVSLSLSQKPLNSKVIKSFVTELRSRKCFSCFGIPMLSMSIMDITNVLRTGMQMSISHIHVWLLYIYIYICSHQHRNMRKYLQKL